MFSAGSYRRNPIPKARRKGLGGGGVAGGSTPVVLERPDRPDADARRTLLKARNNHLGPTSAEGGGGVILGYKRVQSGFDGALA